MKYMMDTNICIYIIKSKPPIVLERFKENYSKGICMSAITLAELAHGVEKSTNREKNEKNLLQLVSIVPVIAFDDKAAREYGQICAHLQKHGTPIGQMDMQIAAHARANLFTLITNNIREFARVPQLKLANWYEPSE